MQRFPEMPELDDDDRAALPDPDDLIASSTQYLLSRGEAGAAQLMLACTADYVQILFPGQNPGGRLSVTVEVAGPARVYDLINLDDWEDEFNKGELLRTAIRAPLPSNLMGHRARYDVTARAQVVAAYEGWREEYAATLSGRGITNQGVNPDGTRAPLRWMGNNFRTRGEIDVAQAFEEANVLFFPLPRAAVGVSPDHRTMAEPDFLVCQDGKWGILEIDGSSHTGRHAYDQERDRLIGLHGVRVIQHFTEEQSRANPQQVVAEFLDYLRRNG